MRHIILLSHEILAYGLLQTARHVLGSVEGCTAYCAYMNPYINDEEAIERLIGSEVFETPRNLFSVGNEPSSYNRSHVIIRASLGTACPYPTGFIRIYQMRIQSFGREC